ncbi:MAG: glycosyltransferase family 2 protein [Anaerolineae bacterium]|nr:glycosyltransferase family 2 protein [Anaerolineae bacterium]
MLQLAVIIVNWNVRDLLLDCLESVRKALAATLLASEVWVVDNASHDGSVEAVGERFPAVHLIASPDNLGFGAGNNLAFRELGFASVPTENKEGAANRKLQTAEQPRYVLLLNPDTVVREDAIRILIDFMEQHGRVGVCGPRLVYGDGSFQHAAYRFPSLAQTLLDFWPLNWRLTDSRLNGRYPKKWYARGEPFPVDHPLGAAMLFRGEVIAQTGGLDPDYRMYVEEIDWCMRVKRAGWEIFCVPEAEVVHLEGQSTRQVRPQMAVALWTSRYTLFRKHYGPLYRWAVRRLIRAGMRGKVRRARQAVRRGEMAAQDAESLIEAYRQIIEM